MSNAQELPDGDGSAYWVTGTWAIAEVTDGVPDTEEYGDYRGLVLLLDDQWEQNLSSVDEGVAAFAEHKGVTPDRVARKEFEHAFYPFYEVLEVTEEQ